MGKSNSDSKVRSSSNSSLDVTTEDFQEDGPSFRVPTKTSQNSFTKRRRGRPRLALSKTSNCIKSSVAHEKKENEVLSVNSQSADAASEDDDIVFLKIEKSLSSECEKLCPTCKLIIPKEEFTDHFSQCLRKFKYNKSPPNDNCADGANLKEYPCPICLKKISPSCRSSHIKSCGQSHGLTSEKIILATRLQEKQAEERTSIGLPPLPLSENKPSLDSRAEHPKVCSKAGKIKVDSELDLALALSSSIVEEEAEKRRKEEDELLQLGLANVVIEERRQRPFILPRPPTGKSQLQGKRSRKQAVRDTLLMTQSSKERERIVSERVAAVLAFNDTGTKSNEKIEEVRLNAALKRYADKELSLWKAAGLDKNSIEEYYVPQLQDYIECRSHSVGGLHKHLSQVPDRLNYTKIDQESDIEEGQENIDSNISNNMEATIVDSYCTQLALAEMLGTQEVKDLTFSNFNDTLEEINEPDYGKLEATNWGFWVDAQVEERDLSKTSSCKVKSSTCSNSQIVTKCLTDIKDVDQESDPFPISSETKETREMETFDSSYSKAENSQESKHSAIYSFTKGDNTAKTETESLDKDILTSHNGTSFDVKMTKNESEVTSNTIRKSPDVNIANRDTSLSSCSSNSPKSSPQATLQNKEIHVDDLSSSSPTQELNSLSSKLTYDWSVILASGDQSDISLETDDEAIGVHRLVLFARCPLMYEEANKTNWKISWKTVSYEAAYAFLIYLYTGQCSIETKEDIYWMSVYDLALKYNCRELVEYLENLYKKSASPLKSNNGFNLTPMSTDSKLSIDLEKDESCEAHGQELNNDKKQSYSPDIFDDCDVSSVCSIITPASSPLPQSVSISPNDALNDEPLSPLMLSISPENIVSNSFSIFQDNSLYSPSKREPTPLKQVDGTESDVSFRRSCSKARKTLAYMDSPSKVSISSRKISCSTNSSFSMDKNNSAISELVDLTEGSDNSDKAMESPPPRVRHSNKNIEQNKVNPSSMSLDNAKIRNSPVIDRENLDKNTREKESNDPDNYGGYFISDVWDGFDDAGLDVIRPLSPTKEEGGESLTKPRCLNNYRNLRDSLPASIEGKERKHEETSACKNAEKGDLNFSFLNSGVGDDTMLQVAAQVEEMFEKEAISSMNKNNEKDTNAMLNVTPLSKSSHNPLPMTPCLITPQPNYKGMVTPELKKELEKFGIRQMSKNKAIKLLLHIYDEMHPMVPDSEADSSRTQTPRNSLWKNSSRKPKKRLLPLSKPSSTNAYKGNCRKKRRTESKNDEDLALGDHGSPLNSSQASNSSTYECLEETLFDPEDEEEEEDTTATQQVLLQDQIKSYISSNNDLHRQVLLYEPLLVQDFHMGLKANDIKCSMKKLIAFLDEQCITFRFKSSGDSRMRKRKRRASQSPKKRQKRRY